MGLSDANTRQHGGDHYQKREYQHWDFVCDTHIHYLLGCATKYVARWQDKGGKLDLEKAVHYLQKAIERDISVHSHARAHTERFAEQLGLWEEKVIKMIMRGEFENAIGEIDHVLENDL